MSARGEPAIRRTAFSAAVVIARSSILLDRPREWRCIVPAEIHGALRLSPPLAETIFFSRRRVLSLGPDPDGRVIVQDYQEPLLVCTEQAPALGTARVVVPAELVRAEAHWRPSSMLTATNGSAHCAGRGGWFDYLRRSRPLGRDHLQTQPVGGARFIQRDEALRVRRTTILACAGLPVHEMSPSEWLARARHSERSL